MEEDVWLDRLMKHLGHWSWVYMLYSYGEKHLLVADQPFLNWLKNAKKTAFRCKTALPENACNAVTPEVKNILVFCEQDELGIVRSLQRQYPDIKVTSGTYGFMQVEQSRRPKLWEYSPPAWPSVQGPVVILSTPYADAEYLAKLMAANGMPYCHEYFSRPLTTWLERHQNFQPARFLAAAAQHLCPDGGMNFLFQTDVLAAVFARSSLSARRFVRWLQRTNAKILVVKRRDQLAQAAFAHLYTRTPERSVWTKNPSKTMQVKYRNDDFSGCLNSLEDIQAGEQLLMDLQSFGLRTLPLYTEDFAANPEQAVNDIAGFIGVSPPSPIEAVNYAEGYDKALGLRASFRQFRRELIDRTGLHAHIQI